MPSPIQLTETNPARFVNSNSEIGSDDDIVRLTINGELRKYTKYSVTAGVMAQPSTISVTLGSGDLAKDLLASCTPGSLFELYVGPTLVQTGILEDVSTGQGSGATEVTVAGRDWISVLTRKYIRHEKHFGSPTYYELTRQVLDICGLTDRALYGDNEANRRNTTRSTTAKAEPATDKVEQIETNAITPAGTKVVYQKIVAKLGQTWYDFLKSQYKQVGLYLWTTPDGNFVLARPTAKQRPLYMLRHGRGITRDETNVISVAYQNRTSGRHAFVRVVGRAGQGENGRGEIDGETNDNEMIAFGFDDEIVIHDHDCKTPRACEFMAFRTVAEERRANCCMTVTVSGHTTPSLLDRGKMVVWAPDTVVSLFSAELGIGDETSGEDFYIEEVTFNRGPQTTTTLKLMRKGDVSFLGESDVDEARFAQDATQRKRNVDVVAGSADQVRI